MKYKQIIISPIKAVLPDITEDDADYILCTMYPENLPSQAENMLVLEFLDTEDAYHPHAFSHKEAGAIRRFIERPAGHDVLFACCDSGESRSAAIAAAILKASGGSDEAIWQSDEYHPNRLVYRILQTVLKE